MAADILTTGLSAPLSASFLEAWRRSGSAWEGCTSIVGRVGYTFSLKTHTQHNINQSQNLSTFIVLNEIPVESLLS